MKQQRMYEELSGNIHAPQALKDRVLTAARQEAAAPKTVKKPKKLWRRGLAAAVLAAVIPVTAFAAARHFGLIEHLKQINFQEPEKAASLVETFPSEAATVPQTLAEGPIQVPEYRVTESICDDESLYVAVEIQPKDERYLLVPSELGTNDDVSYMMIPGVSGMTIEEYAASLGKEILMVGTRLSNDNEYGVSAGLLSQCTAEGTVYQYFTGDNPSDQKEFPLTVTCHYHTLEMPLAERFTFDVTITNRSAGAEMAVTYTQFEDTGLPITIHRAEIRQTELGMYVDFYFTPSDDNDYSFSLLDSQGNYLLNLPGAGGPMSEDNGDGTWVSSWAYQSAELTEGMQFTVTQAKEMEMEVYGPFDIYG